jgi:PGF-pre-PGF domain-containing protein
MTLSNNKNSIYINSSSNNQIKDNTLNASVLDAIVLNATSSGNNNFTSVIVTNANAAYYTYKFNTEGINGTWFIDSPFANYSFTGNGGLINFKSSSYGVISFLAPVNGAETGNNDISISNNLIFVNSFNSAGLNKSANITIYDPGYANPKPQYSDDGITFTDCTTTSAPACTELGFSGTTFTFNTTHFTYFKAAETPTTVVPPTTGGSSSGGGGAGAAGGSTSTYWAEVSADTLTSMEIFGLPNVPAAVIEFTLSEPATAVKMVVSALSDKPTTITTDPVGTPYKYFGVETSNVDATKIASATIKFRVDKAWITENNVDVSTIKLARFTSQWDILETKQVGEDAAYMQYEATTPGFSTFVVIAETIGGQTVTTTPATTTTTTTTTQPSTIPTQLQKPANLGILAAIIAVIAIIGYIMMKKPKASKRKGKKAEE